MHVCLFEDIHFTNFLPLAYLRPVYELRCGALSLREKIETSIPRPSVSLHVRPDLAGFWREEQRAFPVNEIADRDTWFINGRVVADEKLMKLVRRKNPRGCAYVNNDGDIAAAYIEGSQVSAILRSWPRPFGPDSLAGIPSEPCECTLVKYPWDLVTQTPREIERDFGRRSGSTRAAGRSRVHRGAHVLNRKNVFIGRDSVIKPGAVLDAEEGPVILGRDVTVLSNAVIQGPAFVGDHSVIRAGAKIYHGTSIGAHCKVGGEVEASVIQSHSNKQHDGFLGHSYLASWVNIGAGTNTSDLKNTYGPVKVRLGETEIDTGLQFVGLTMGDHSKTGINVMFDTGTVVGVSCNLFGAGLPPKFVPSFAWGEKNALTLYQPDKALETSRRMMVRRDVRMSPAYERRMRDVFSWTEGERRKAGIS